MKKILLSILFLTLCTTAWAGRLDDPSYLKFYARLNSNTSDYSGHGVTAGTFTGEAYTTTPWGSTGANFDGTDDKIAYGSVSAGIKSVSFWCKPATTTEQFMEVASGVDIDVASGTIGTTGWTSPTVYVNGQISSTLTTTWQFVTVTSATAINANATNLGVETTNFGDTDLAEVRFYNIALTADEVQELYQREPHQYTASQQPLDLIPDISDPTLKGAWLNRGVWQSAKDLSSNNNDGTTIDIQAWLDVGAVFVKDADQIDMGDRDSLHIYQLTSFTNFMWIYFDDVDTSADVIICKGKQIVGHCLDLSDDDNAGSANIRVTVFHDTTNARSIITDKNIKEFQWHNIVYTYNEDGDKKVKIYLDGSLESSSTTAGDGAITDDSSVVRTYTIGNRDDASNGIDGKVKDVRFYSEAKTASWIKAEYAKSVPDDSLVLHVSSTGKDLSRYDTTITATSAILGSRGIEFSNGGLAWSSITFTGYGYWYKTGGKWTHYYNNGTTTYTNGVATGSMPKAITSTGFATTTATMDNIVAHNEAKSADWVKQDYEKTKIYY